MNRATGKPSGWVQLELPFPEGQGGTGGHGSCSTKYVRGREALRPELCGLAFIANRNVSFILREVW